FFLTSTGSFRQLGGFDEAYFLHVEDVDLCKRCREAGGHVLYDPRANALHHGATSDAPGRTVAAHKADSLALYFDRHATGPLERLAARLLMPIAKWVMLAARRD
ncbi:MAG: glycosyltransferase family 2 protein, partial [Pseudomonadota bacterium]